MATSPDSMNQNAANYWKQWQDEVNSLCFEIFMSSDAGKRLLTLWEQKYFYAPVADPNHSVAYARFNEGRNNFIRGMRSAAYAAMSAKESQTIQKDLNYESINES